MENIAYAVLDRKVIMRVRRRFCETPDELLQSGLFRDVLRRCLRELARRDSPMLAFLGGKHEQEASLDILIQSLSFLTKIPLALVPNIVAGAASFPEHRTGLADFVEYLYNFWRSFERYAVCDSEGDALDKRPYRTFNETVENFSHLVRGVYRDVQENIQGMHPRIYRQLHAGVEISAIALTLDIPLPPGPYEKLRGVAIIRQILLNPPLILEPPMNKRTGSFIRVPENPIERVTVDASDWLCYPARVGDLLVLIYFHNTFFELGFSLCNLFEIADDADLGRAPDALYIFGDPTDGLSGIAEMPTVFHDDAANRRRASPRARSTPPRPMARFAASTAAFAEAASSADLTRERKASIPASSAFKAYISGRVQSPSAISFPTGLRTTSSSDSKSRISSIIWKAIPMSYPARRRVCSVREPALASDAPA